jgi:16S rRNA (adenine(1408)-N(1))-methyltransferase
VIVDLGCGDGRAALALATSAGPGTLVLAADPVAAVMAESSRRAARSAPNLVFLEASAEALAAFVPGVADDVAILFPWGSLLRGVLGFEPCVGAALAALLKPGGRLSALVSVTQRDGVPGLATLDAGSAHSLSPSPDLTLVEARPATREEVLATRSTWGKRLLSGRTPDARPVWRLDWRRLR